MSKTPADSENTPVSNMPVWILLSSFLAAMGIASVGIFTEISGKQDAGELLSSVQEAAVQFMNSGEQLGWTDIESTKQVDGDLIVSLGTPEGVKKQTIEAEIVRGKMVQYDLIPSNPGGSDYILVGTMYHSNNEPAYNASYSSASNKTTVNKGKASISTVSFAHPDASPVSKETANNSSSGRLGQKILVPAGAGAILLVGAGFGIRSFTRKKRARSTQGVDNREQWERLIELHRSVKVAWSNYELDIMKIIDYPTMIDMSDEHTVRLHEALERAARLAPSSVKKVVNMSPLGSPYETAVTELNTAFKAAEAHAKKVSWSNFTEVERRNLRRAKSLLDMAYDCAASPAERQSAYRRALKELDGLIVPPVQAVAALEQKVTLQIESASTSNTNIDLDSLLKKTVTEQPAIA